MVVKLRTKMLRNSCIPINRVLGQFSRFMVGVGSTYEGYRIQDVRFFFDGRRIRVNDTAQDIGMEDGDAIQVFQEQPSKFSRSSSAGASCSS